MKKDYPYPSGGGSVKWVSTDWLFEHLEDQNVTILDVQPNVYNYVNGHIANAVYLNEGVLRAPSNGIPTSYVSPESIQPILRGAGLDPEVPVVVYTGIGRHNFMGDGLEQTMMAYSLARFGHNKIYVLDGGIDKWSEEKKPLTKVIPNAKKSEFTVKIQKELFVEYKEFKAIKDRKDVLQVDARPPQFFEGRDQNFIKPGHIPGGINLPWRRLMNDKNRKLLKEDDEIQSILEEHGITRDKNILCYCGTGREATSEVILFKWYLGLPNVKLYEGSFIEWVSHSENPTVTGKNPR